MTQVILTKSSYLLNLLVKFLILVKSAVVRLCQVIIEARQKQANVKIARYLMSNSDFKDYSFSEIMQMLEDGKINR